MPSTPACRALLALALTLVPGLPAASSDLHEVHMLTRGSGGAMVFEPDYLQVAPGDRVRFLATQKSHNAASIPGMIPEGATPFRGGIDEEIVVTFDTPGRHGVMCMPHVAMGMVMVIDVGPVGARNGAETGGGSPEALPDTLPPRARARLREILGD